MTPVSFDRFAGWSGLAVALGGVAYSAAFIIGVEKSNAGAINASSLILMCGGFLATAVVIALFQRLRNIDLGFAAWGTLLVLVGLVGSALHGGHDLAVAIKHPSGTVASLAANPTDPRGLSTFAVTGLGVLVLSWLMLRSGDFPARLARLGVLSGVMLLVVYLGRLLVFNPKNGFLLTVAILSGFIVSPGWFAWLGLVLLGREPRAAKRRAGVGVAG
jgi:hypothetical protein